MGLIFCFQMSVYSFENRYMFSLGYRFLYDLSMNKFRGFCLWQLQKLIYRYGFSCCNSDSPMPYKTPLILTAIAFTQFLN